MDGRARVATLAIVLAGLLALAPFAPQGGGGVDCERPSELHAVAERTVAAACERPGARALRGPARLLFGLGLDPNQADVASLEALPGIGPARAAAIAAERCRRPFASAADLARVSGIGPRTTARLAGWLELRSTAAARCIQ